MNLLRRRDLLAAGAGGLAAWPGLPWLAHGQADAAAPSADGVVRFLPEMEAVARWIEETPAEGIVEATAAKIRAGLPERLLVGGLFLAGIRSIKPRPVGFKFHAVMVIAAAHELSITSPAAERLLPFFWAVNYFKACQAQDIKEGDWSLAPVREADVPPADKAAARFTTAMDAWDVEAADGAIAALARSASAGEVADLLWPYAVRDWRNIGHKAIFTSHALRTLDLIGWEHSEPVLRSLVYGLLDGGPGGSSEPFTISQERAAGIGPGWRAGKPDSAATADLLDVLREAGPDDAARATAAAVSSGVAARSLWDAILLAGSELLMRRPFIITMHATTSASGLFDGFRRAGSDRARLLCLLQGAAWMAMFRAGSGKLPPGPRIDALEPSAEPPAEAEAIFSGLRQDRLAAAGNVLAYAEAGGSPAAFFAAARHLAVTRGTDPHDFKFPAAACDDVIHASPEVRPRLLAASVFWLRDSGDQISPVVERARAALAAS
jgi:hypothetical protein